MYDFVCIRNKSQQQEQQKQEQQQEQEQLLNLENAMLALKTSLMLSTCAIRCTRINRVHT